MPRGRPTTPRRISRELDRQLLELLTRGRVCVDPRSGGVLLDSKREPVRKPPSASDLNIARQRLRDVGYDEETDNARSIARQIERIRLKHQAEQSDLTGGFEA